MVDYDAQGNLVGIDIDNASAKVEIHKLTSYVTRACSRRSTKRAAADSLSYSRVIRIAMGAGMWTR